MPGGPPIHRIFACTICHSEIAIVNDPSPDEKTWKPAAPMDFESDPVRELTCEEVVIDEVMDS